jgi:hypothetical protein
VRCENGASAPASFADVEPSKNRARDFPAIEGGAAEPAPHSRGKQYRRKPEKQDEKSRVMGNCEKKTNS